MDAGGWASLREVGSFGLMAFLCAVRRSAMSGKGVEGVGAVVEQGDHLVQRRRHSRAA